MTDQERNGHAAIYLRVSTPYRTEAAVLTEGLAAQTYSPSAGESAGARKARSRLIGSGERRDRGPTNGVRSGGPPLAKAHRRKKAASRLLENGRRTGNMARRSGGQHAKNGLFKPLLRVLAPPTVQLSQLFRQ